MKRAVILVLLSGCVVPIVEMEPPEAVPPNRARIRICSNGIHVVISDKLGPEYVEMTSSSIRWWNDRIGAEVLIDAGQADIPDRPGNGYIAILPASPSEIATWSKKSTIGRFRPVRNSTNTCTIGGSIHVSNRDGFWMNDTMALMITHELGHALLGRYHSKTPYTMMWGIANRKRTEIMLAPDTVVDAWQLYGSMALGVER